MKLLTSQSNRIDILRDSRASAIIKPFCFVFISALNAIMALLEHGKA